MSAKIIEKLSHNYPESHIHCDVTKAGLDSYLIAVSLISRDGETLASVEHSGNGHLDVLKTEAYQKLADTLEDGS